MQTYCPFIQETLNAKTQCANKEKQPVSWRNVLNEFDLLETGLQRICRTESEHTPVAVILININKGRLPKA